MVGRTTGSIPAGTVLGSYRVLGELSSGSMGTVMRAEHLLLGRPAAVKLLRRDLTTNPGLVQRFVNEAKAVTASKHPGIVEVYDFGYTPDGHAFIVMELLEGEPLGQRLARVRMSEPEAVVIALGIASALKAAHKVGVIHRDLKPDNVFLVPDPDGGTDRPKVLDFGIAKLADPAASGHTATGALIGTPMYMAPEQARAASTIDHRADLYSLGCLLYHMLAGRPPFVAEGGGEIIALQMFGQVEPPSRLATISPEMDALVLRLLEKEPAQRPDSAAEVMTALAAIDTALTGQGGWRAAPAARWTPPAASADSVGPSPGAPLQLGDDVRPGLVPDKRSAMPMIAAVVTVLAIAGVAITFAVTRSTAASPTAASPTAASPNAASPNAASPNAASPNAASPNAASPNAASPNAASPNAASPNAASPTVASPTVASPTVASPTAASPTAASPNAAPARTKRTARKPAAAKPAAQAAGPVTHPGDPGAPDRAIEVIRDIRQVEPPVSGPHTRDGSPMELSVDPGTRPKPAAIADPPKDAP
jgi:serine/threonine-protein kinase